MDTFHCGERMKELTRQSNLSGTEINQQMNKGEKYIYQLFPKQHISTKAISRFCEVIGISIQEFFCGEEENEVSESLVPYKKEMEERLSDLEKKLKELEGKLKG